MQAQQQRMSQKQAQQRMSMNQQRMSMNSGNPMMGAARTAITKLEATAASEEANGVGNPSVNFSRRVVRT